MRENVLKEIGDKEKNDDSKVMQGKLIKKNKIKRKKKVEKSAKSKEKRMASEGNRAVMEMIILVNSIGDVK